MKTLLPEVLGPLQAVLDELSAVRPELHDNLRSYFERIHRLCQTRGWKQVLLIEFPAASKHLERSVYRGYLYYKDAPPILSLNKAPLFKELYLDIFEGFGGDRYLLPDPSAQSFYFLRQIFLLYKKLEVECPPSAVKAAVEDYFEIDREVRRPSLDWGSGDFSVRRGERIPKFADILSSPETSFEEKFQKSTRNWSLLMGMDTLVERFLTVPELKPFDLLPKHGPGAVSDLKSGDDKYRFRFWPKRLEPLCSWSYFARSSELIALLNDDEPVLVEPEGKLMAVPKTYDKPRLITVESTAMQFLQQGLLKYIRESLPSVLRTSINFLDQDPSRDAALEASRTGDFATVDLSSASDRLSCWLVERVFRCYGGILPYLDATRTVVVHDHTGCNMGSLELRKFAGMGSAVTFPVQSICYALIAIAVVVEDFGGMFDEEFIVKCAAGKVRVFGDDIIVPSHVVPRLAELLAFFGLKVNWGKTHDQGPFRESCGMDSFSGMDVTPTYLRTLKPENTPGGLSSWVSVRNNAEKRGLSALTKWMDDQLDPSILRLIPEASRPLAVSRATLNSLNISINAEDGIHPCRD